MNRLRAAVVGGLSALPVLLATVPPAAAQGAPGRDYPVRPLHIIVAFSPGTTSDTIARAVASELASQLGVSVLIENREGAGGHIGHTAAARAPADGYTLLMGTTWMALTPHSSSPPAYDAVKDFMPIARVGQAPMLVVAGSSTVNRSWAELLAHARRGDINYGTSGKGGASHVFTEILKHDFGFRGQDIPYRNTSQAMIDVSTGKLDFYLANLPPARGLLQSGQLLPIAVGSKQRIAALPDTPTLAELSSRPDYEVVVWYGFFAPAGTPAAIVSRLQQEIAKASATPAVRSRLEEAGGTLSIAGPEELGRQVETDNLRFGRIVKELGLKP